METNLTCGSVLVSVHTASLLSHPPDKIALRVSVGCETAVTSLQNASISPRWDERFCLHVRHSSYELERSKLVLRVVLMHLAAPLPKGTSVPTKSTKMTIVAVAESHFLNLECSMPTSQQLTLKTIEARGEQAQEFGNVLLTVTWRDYRRFNAEQTQRNCKLTDSYGFMFDTEAQYHECLRANTKIATGEIGVLDMVNSKDVSKTELRQMFRAGISPVYRAEVWMVISGAKDRRRMSNGEYDLLVQSALKSHVAAKEEIEKDIRRTFPNHSYYSTSGGANALRRVLTAYSLRNQGIGYCQSLNYLCGMMLLFADEETAFWLLATVCEQLFPNYYSRTMIGTQIDQIIFEQLCTEVVPELQQHVQKLNMQITILAMRWFLCVFIDVVPTETAMRIWDILFCEGSEFIFQSGIGLLKVIEADLLSCDGLEELLIALSHTQTIFDADYLIHTSLAFVPETQSLAQKRHDYYLDIAKIDRRARDDSSDDDDDKSPQRNARRGSGPGKDGSLKLKTHIPVWLQWAASKTKGSASDTDVMSNSTSTPSTSDLSPTMRQEQEIQELKMRVLQLEKEKGALEATLAETSRAQITAQSQLQATNEELAIIRDKARAVRTLGVVKKGFLEKKSQQSGRWQKRYFVLKEGLLTYHKTENYSLRHPTGCIYIPFANINVDADQVLHILDDNKDYSLRASAVPVLFEWLRALLQEQANFISDRVRNTTPQIASPSVSRIASPSQDHHHNNNNSNVNNNSNSSISNSNSHHTTSRNNYEADTSAALGSSLPWSDCIL